MNHAPTLDVVIDTETTGLGHIRGRMDGIVQIGYAVRVDGDIESWHRPAIRVAHIWLVAGPMRPFESTSCPPNRCSMPLRPEPSPLSSTVG